MNKVGVPSTGQREIPEREPYCVAQLFLHEFDRPERLPRVRALVVAVLQDHPAPGRAADVIDRLVHRHHAARHGKFLLAL
jgi:hypothetical protein